MTPTRRASNLPPTLQPRVATPLILQLIEAVICVSVSCAAHVGYFCCNNQPDGCHLVMNAHKDKHLMLVLE